MTRRGVRRWLTVPWTGRVAREIDDEIELHVNLRTQRLIEQGLHPEVARAEAERLFGGKPARDYLKSAGEQRMTTMKFREELGNLRFDLRFIARQLRRSPAFTAAAVLTIALGVGANATMFAVVDRLLLRPPAGVQNPDRVMTASVEMTLRSRVATQEQLSYPIFTDLASDSSFSHVAAYSWATLSLGSGASAREVDGMRVTPGYFAVLGVRPLVGRLFDPTQRLDVPAPAEAVASESFWRTQFGGSPAAIGQTFELGGTRFRLIGVVAGGFTGLNLDPVSLWIPYSTGATPAQIAGWNSQRQYYSMRIIGRLRERVTPEAAAASATLQVRRGDLRDGASEEQVRNRQPTVRLVSALPRDARGKSAVSRVAVLLGAMSLLVLILAAANVMNLQLARASSRSREVSVRLALGISRGRLLRLLISESLLVGALGGLAAILVARWGSEFMRQTLLAGAGPETSLIDWRACLYAATAALVVGAVIGLVPALQSIGPDLITTLRTGAQPGGSRTRMRRMLLVVQSALAVVLLVGTGLFARSLRRVESLPLGLDPQNVVVIRLNTTGRQYDAEALDAMFGALERTAKSLPEVEHAALTMSMPFGATTSAPVFVPGRDSLPVTGEGGPYVNIVGYDYFAALKTPMVAGRSFNAQDGPGTERVAIINETTARLWWPRESPLGKCVRMFEPQAACATIVGVAANARRQSMIEGDFVQLFVLASQIPSAPTRTLVARLRGDPDRAIPLIQRSLQGALPGLPLVNVLRLADRVADRKRSWEMGAAIFGAFGALAIALAAIGLYGVLAYEISQRRREIGIRLALGAASSRVTGMVVGQGLTLAAIGSGAGLLIALLMSSRVEPLLFQTSRIDPVIYSLAAVVILGAAMLASWLPARRASRIDPAVVLQSD